MMDKDIISLYESGLSQKEIAELFDISPKVTRAILQEHGFTTHNYRHINPLLYDIIVLLIKEGYCQNQISELCDVSVFVIREIVKKEKLQGKSQLNRQKKRNKIIVKLYKSHYTKKHIQEVLHIELRTINKALEEVGLYQPKDKIENEVLELFHNGTSIKNISATLNITTKRVVRILERKGEGYRNE